MIVLSAPTFDLEGFLVLRGTQNSRCRGGTRRVTRTATLDGGAALTDLGFSDADRTLEIVAERFTARELSRAEYLLRTYPQLVAATEDGCYRGAVQSVAIAQGALQVSFLVAEKVG